MTKINRQLFKITHVSNFFFSCKIVKYHGTYCNYIRNVKIFFFTHSLKTILARPVAPRSQSRLSYTTATLVFPQIPLKYVAPVNMEAKRSHEQMDSHFLRILLRYNQILLTFLIFLIIYKLYERPVYSITRQRFYGN